MRYFAKITTTFALALVFSAGMAFGQDQDAEIEQFGTNTDADISQVGDVGNDASITQGTESNPVGQFEAPSASILQDGGNNTATVTQGNDNSGAVGVPEASIEQIGDRNTGTVSQAFGATGSTVNIGEIYQSGNDNTATLTQRHFGGIQSFTTNVVGSIEQKNGDFNTATVTQKGSGAAFRADVVQDGSDNTATLTQNDFGSAANLYDGDIMQVGSMNNATITQTP